MKVRITGEYEEPKTHRAGAKIKATTNGFYSVTVSLPDESGNCDVYNFTGTFDDDGKLSYVDGVKTHEDYSTEGKTVTKQLYKNGSGSITITDKKLKWVNNNEDVDVTEFELVEK